MNLTELIQHPELLNKETLYDLRSHIAMYPYHQSARLLMLQNLYLLHDPMFDEELRRASIFITNRKVLFNLVEASHYTIRHTHNDVPTGNRTVSLIDNFLSTIPTDEEEEKKKTAKETGNNKRLPTIQDATIDYVSYLCDTNFEGVEETAEMKGQSLIDDFITREGGRMSLKDEIEFKPESETVGDNAGKNTEEEYFTETLAGIYIKQGGYSKALEIIKRLNLEYPKKNAYFADQIRFLEKLIINSESGKKKSIADNEEGK